MAIAVVLAGLAAAGCGGEDERAAAAPAPPPATLPAAAVPYLESEERRLTAATVAKETGLPELAGRLAGWGYESGASRHFQGQSKRLQVVDARAYRFRSAAGAAAFMRLIRADPDAFFAAGGRTRAFVAGGRRGLAIEGLPCACHMAQPAYFAALADGTTVRSLEINGPNASIKALRALAAETP